MKDELCCTSSRCFAWVVAEASGLHDRPHEHCVLAWHAAPLPRSQYSQLWHHLLLADGPVHDDACGCYFFISDFLSWMRNIIQEEEEEDADKQDAGQEAEDEQEGEGSFTKAIKAKGEGAGGG